MKNIQSAIFLSFILFLFLIPVFVQGRVGVGIGTGKIVVQDKLKPGQIYNLPHVAIVNTGDEAAKFEVGISQIEKQKELYPTTSWFIFSPHQFQLEPGKVQIVDIKLNLPLNAKPGNYFAFVEGYPLRKSVAGSATIGVAAAAKLYFTVVPANIFFAAFYKAVSFWNIYTPWPERVTIVVAVIILAILFKKFFNIQINLKKPSNNPPVENKP